MKSFVLFSYDQPKDGPSWRCGVLEDVRDCKKQPVSPQTLVSPYRQFDRRFKRTDTLETVRTREGVKAFYRERQSFRVKIPFLGSVIGRFM